MKRSVAIAAFAMVGMSGCSTPADDVGAGGAIQATLSVTSADFADGTPMPDWTTANALGGQCAGDNTNPQLSWESPSTGTAGFALTMIDTDARDFVHWMLADIPASTTSIERGAADEAGAVGGKGTLSSEYDGTYFGPCPPGPDHHYVFTVYALDAALALEPGFTFGELKAAMKGHILAQGSVTGLRSGPA